MTDDAIYARPRRAEPLKVGDRIFKSAYDWELTEKDLEIAACELGETEEKKTECLRKLKAKLESDSNIRCRLDDFYLLRFLRVRKYDVKKAYQNMKLFFEERKKYSEFFVLPQNLKSLLQLNFFTVLPYTNEEGSIMIWLNLNRWDPTENSFEEIIQTVTTVLDIVSMNPHCHINGTIDVWNLDGLSMRHVSKILLNGRLSAALSVAQNGYPWRIKKVILLNTNRIVRFLYNLVKPILQTKVAQRVILLGSDMSELHQHVNPALLPEALQGTLDEKECDMSQHVLENLPYLKYERTFISH